MNSPRRLGKEYKFILPIMGIGKGKENQTYEYNLSYSCLLKELRPCLAFLLQKKNSFINSTGMHLNCIWESNLTEVSTS